ncbi:unnamed protein product [Vicia faba]|uniref:Uncharacterized protein n=1 Tax=Vicia faba TaxID=3906 RepID=A0AAV1ADI1_VICFA|nr:unnamed protein product [Vicia faba]
MLQLVRNRVYLLSRRSPTSLHLFLRSTSSSLTAIAAVNNGSTSNIASTRLRPAPDVTAHIDRATVAPTQHRKQRSLRSHHEQPNQYRKNRKRRGRESRHNITGESTTPSTASPSVATTMASLDFRSTATTVFRFPLAYHLHHNDNVRCFFDLSSSTFSLFLRSLSYCDIDAVLSRS